MVSWSETETETETETKKLISILLTTQPWKSEHARGSRLFGWCRGGEGEVYVVMDEGSKLQSRSFQQPDVKSLIQLLEHRSYFVNLVSFFQVSTSHQQFSLPFVLIPSSGIIYRMLFSSNSMALSRLCQIIVK